MKIKVNQALKGFDDAPLKGDKGVIVTLKDVCINSLLTPIQGDDEKVKWEKYEIYRKLKESKVEVELKLEEVTMLKKCVGRIQPHLLMGQVWEILERNGKDG